MSSGVFTLPLTATDASAGKAHHGLNGHSQPFIAGGENALLRALIDAVFSNPPSYNPITLYGATGAGKSHLLYGLVERLRTLDADRKAWLLTGADFARLYARAVELDNLSEFQEKLLSADVLVVDGLEELATKRAAQQQLLNTIDSSLAAESQLLFSCRSGSTDWSWMLSGLRSRLEGGLTIPVALPEASTRIEIVRRLAKDYGVTIPDEAIEQLAKPRGNHSTSLLTFGQLRSAVLSLVSEAQSSTSPAATVESNKPVIGQESPQEAIRTIAKAAARHFDLKLTDLIGASRRKTVVQARAVAIFLARSLLDVSFDQIGKSFGDRDHTTILHAHRKIASSLNSDSVLKQTIEKLSHQLTSPKAS